MTIRRSLIVLRRARSSRWGPNGSVPTDDEPANGGKGIEPAVSAVKCYDGAVDERV
jgi:hypothetical protein